MITVRIADVSPFPDPAVLIKAEGAEGFKKRLVEARYEKE